jgi:hypothetical protein
MPYDPNLTVGGQEVAAAARGQTSEYGRQEAMFLLIRTPLDASALVAYWKSWTVITAVSAVLSGLVIVLILARPKLRRTSFNHLLIGLVVPDFLFSFLCGITCALHAAHGRWYDGEGIGDGQWMCDFQSFYSVFGTAGSIWVNVLITFEMRRISRSMRSRQTYVRPTCRQIWMWLVLVYAGVGALAWVLSYGYRSLPPSFAAKPESVRGLNCLPIEYDVASQRFEHRVTVRPRRAAVRARRARRAAPPPHLRAPSPLALPCPSRSSRCCSTCRWPSSPCCAA